jgi:tetratricopeptide (TPR) repeat protein
MHKMKHYVLFVILVNGLFTSCKPDSKDSTEEKKSDSTYVDFTMSDSARLAIIEKMAEAGNYQRCLEHIDWLLKKDSSFPLYLYIKADALENTGDTANAIVLYKKANEKAGFFLQASMRLLNLYAEKGDPATLSLADTLLAHPETEKIQSDILLMKGIYYQNTNDRKNAGKIYDQIIRKDYTFLQAYIEKGLLYYDDKEYKKAMKVFELSTTVKNDFADGYFWQGKTYLKMNQPNEAILHFKKSLALDPSLEAARNELKTLKAIQ